MKNDIKRKIIEYGVAVLLFVIVLAFSCAVSWITTCGIIYLITLCFGWTFKWSIATGIWLILILVGSLSIKVIKNDN